MDETDRLRAEIQRLRAERDALVQRLREVRAQLTDTIDRHRQKVVMNAWAEQRLARHGIPMPEAPACPDCHGVGYDASGQLCACQENPSF